MLGSGRVWEVERLRYQCPWLHASQTRKSTLAWYKWYPVLSGTGACATSVAPQTESQLLQERVKRPRFPALPLLTSLKSAGEGCDEVCGFERLIWWQLDTLVGQGPFLLVVVSDSPAPSLARVCMDVDVPAPIFPSSSGILHSASSIHPSPMGSALGGRREEAGAGRLPLESGYSSQTPVLKCVTMNAQIAIVLWIEFQRLEL
ncbi:hypothetical protein STEG23_038128 [Scotinomys teguina]